jgi:hypothetical protein
MPDLPDEPPAALPEELPDDLPVHLLTQLVDLIDRLRSESQGFLDAPGDQQLWYNRGYANGMLLALRRLGQAKSLGDRAPDDPEQLGGHLAMPWGRAYRHGEDKGSQETFEITGSQPS